MSRAPQPPGRLGQPADPMAMRTYLGALGEWIQGRRVELDELDQLVRSHPDSTELTKDIALNLHIWQTISKRYHALLQIWDGGRVARIQIEQLSNLMWGRLDDPTGRETGNAGMNLYEACRTSDALVAQLRTRLNVNPADTAALGRLHSMRQTMERLRDQVKREPADTADKAQNYMASLTARLADLEARQQRGGDIGGLIGSLEADAARFERDMIVNGAVRRGSPIRADQHLEATTLRARLLEREAALQQMVDRAESLPVTVPRYAVPDVAALGEVPGDPGALAGFVARLTKISQAMDMLEDTYGTVLRRYENQHAIDEAARALADRPDEHSFAQMAAQIADREDLPEPLLAALAEFIEQWSAWVKRGESS